jgi:hypothetical protein
MHLTVPVKMRMRLLSLSFTVTTGIIRHFYLRVPYKEWKYRKNQVKSLINIILIQKGDSACRGTFLANNVMKITFNRLKNHQKGVR